MQQTIHDILERGVDGATICTDPRSELKDIATIKDILHDTLAVSFVFSITCVLTLHEKAYSLLAEALVNPSKLDGQFVCKVHASLMDTCRFIGCQYTPPGETRTSTRKSVIIHGAYNIQCCPFLQVDNELEYICKMSRVGIIYARWNLLTDRCSAIHQDLEKSVRYCELDSLVTCSMPSF